jgi:ribonuclease HII
MPPDFLFERDATPPVCGIDEAGRGPWAGPVVAAAVVLDTRRLPAGLDDSKRLTPARRDALHAELAACALVGVGISSVEEIDRVNILQASFLAMRRAVAALDGIAWPALALVDGPLAPPGLGCPVRPVVGGDGRCLSIAAASIVAKVTRDRIMVALAQQFPGYGWETNMGYGVPEHAAGLARLGVTPHHRRSFAPVHKMLWEAESLSP